MSGPALDMLVLQEERYRLELASADEALAQVLAEHSTLKQRIVELAAQNATLRSAQPGNAGPQISSVAARRLQPAPTAYPLLPALEAVVLATLLSLLCSSACVFCLWYLRS